jgi:hypothetical protein
MIKRKDFCIQNISAEAIQKLQQIGAKSSGSQMFEYYLWTKDDGKQEVKLYFRALRQTIEGILADLGF